MWEVLPGVVSVPDTPDSTATKLWVSDREGNLVLVSDAWYAYAGLPRDDALGCGWLEAVHPDDRQLCLGKLEAALARRAPYAVEYRLRRADGQYRWVVDAARPRLGDGGEFAGFVGVVIDIHQRKMSELVRMESDRLFRLLADNIGCLVWMADPQGRTFWCNRRWRDYAGVSLEEIVTSDYSEFVHPEHMERIALEFQAAWSAGQPWRGMALLRAKDGSYRWFLCLANPIHGNDGEIVSWVGTCTDVNQEVEVEEELRSAQRELERALSLKDEFLGLVSHELRTPLTAILAGSRLMSHELSAEQQREVAAEVATNADRLATLVENMLILARPESDSPTASDLEPLQLQRIVAAAVKRHGTRFPGRRILLQVGTEDIIVEGQKAWIDQILENYLGNAEKYANPDAQFVVQVERVNQEAIVRVLDEGPGLSDVNIDELFDAFYRSSVARWQAKGVGLGLAVVKRLVTIQGGRVWARNRRDVQGAEFGFALPLSRFAGLV
ncbi:MAG: PAS domain-containing sensor histidine kinase [Dehalococcoidia bacterium]|nr:PAS domain-containing sensor histidine kinase [Dehalococcoidia bacterium]